jgi:UDP:flavonoid glycosyltransferase YjiC (YdhE family)
VRRALFFPWSAGGGAGYTCRCLALAARVSGEYACGFGPEALTGLVEDAGFPVVGSRSRRPAGAPRHDYLPFASVERVYAATARYYRADLVREHVRRDRAAIEAHDAELVVVDMQPTAAIAARSMGLPVVSIADADFLSPSPRAWMPWLTLAPEELLPYPPCLPAFNEVLAELGLASIDSPTQLLWGEVTLVPSCSELEPLTPPPVGHRAAVHIGPLYWDPPTAAARLPHARAGAARVYVTLGSGGMIGGLMLQRLLDTLARPEMIVFASTGLSPPPGLARPGHVHLGGFTGLTRAIRWSDVVITHGGYSSVIAAISLARPQVVLPLMSEHEANGRQLVERHGCGLLMRATRTDPHSRGVRFVNRHSGESDSAVPEPQDILATLNAILSDGGWRERTEAMARRLDDARKSCDAIELFALAQT